MRSFFSEVVEPNWSGDWFSVLQQLDTWRTGNNPADLGEVEPELLCKACHVDLWRRNYDLVFLPRGGGVHRGGLIETWNPREIDFDVNFARSCNMADVRDQAVRDVDGRRRTSRREPDRWVDPGNRTGETSPVTL